MAEVFGNMGYIGLLERRTRAAVAKRGSIYEHHASDLENLFKSSFESEDLTSLGNQFVTVIMASRQPVSRPNMSQVRRNLFHGNLSRRPTSASTSTSAATQLNPLNDNNLEIIMRDPQGNYQIYIPTLPLSEEVQAQLPEEGEQQSTDLALAR